MSSTPESLRPGILRSRRLKIDVACQTCRSRKVKCDGARPACRNCQKKDSLRDSCTYHNPGPREVTSPRQTGHPKPSSVNSERLEAPEFRGVYYVGVPSIFAGELKAAIDARYGLPSGGRSNLTPMMDAPLFGLLPRHHTTDNNIYDVDNVLPPRKHADQLIDIYWRYIQPLEPFLEKERFTDSYHALFDGRSLNTDERIFISSLNAIFALSTQIQECMEPGQREQASNAFFHRAWALIRPETILWEPGSLEIVQCLLLLGRYLQCTNNPHQTWMAIGSAVRIAQSLGLHVPNITPHPPPPSPMNERLLRRQLWQCCVYMDRCISWAFGKASMVSSTVSSATLDLPPNYDGDSQNADTSATCFMKTLELYEIANHVMLSQVSACSNTTNRLGLPRLYENGDYFGTAVQLDNCIGKWEKELPQLLKHDGFQVDVDDTLHRQRVMLRLRFLHARIFLFRPMLARICLAQSETATNSSIDQGLGDRVLQNSAFLCVEGAQKMINLIHEYHKPVGPVAVIPWWSRIFYLHIASTILIAAMLRADIFTPIISQSWSKAMSTLQAHEHLGPFVQQCVTTFQMLSCKIMETHHASGGQFPSLEGYSSTYFQEVFQDMGLEPDNFLFGREDMAWLSNFDAAQ